MSLETILANVAGQVAERLVRHVVDGKPLVGVPLEHLMRKSEWQKIERAALREAARRRVEG